MSRRLRTDVYANDIRYPAGTAEKDVPAGAIGNPKAWIEVEEAEIVDGTGTVHRTDQVAVEEPGPDGPGLPPIPPKSGPGSSVEAWAAYAAAHNVKVPDNPSRASIIETLDAVGVPTS